MIIAWLVLSIVVGFLCINRTVGFFGGLMVSLVLSPLVGFIIMLVSDKVQPKIIVNPEIELLKAEIEALKNK